MSGKEEIEHQLDEKVDLLINCSLTHDYAQKWAHDDEKRDFAVITNNGLKLKRLKLTDFYWKG